MVGIGRFGRGSANHFAQPGKQARRFGGLYSTARLPNLPFEVGKLGGSAEVVQPSCRLSPA